MISIQLAQLGLEFPIRYKRQGKHSGKGAILKIVHHCSQGQSSDPKFVTDHDCLSFMSPLSSQTLVSGAPLLQATNSSSDNCVSLHSAQFLFVKRLFIHVLYNSTFLLSGHDKCGNTIKSVLVK